MKILLGSPLVRRCLAAVTLASGVAAASFAAHAEDFVGKPAQNMPASSPRAMTAPKAAKALSPGAATCSRIIDGGFTTTSASFMPVLDCGISVPEAGFVLIHATSSLGRSDGDYEARFELSVDGTPSNATDRWINVFSDATDGSDRGVETSFIAVVEPGEHRFGLHVARYNGAGEVQLYDPQIQALYIPQSHPQVRQCHAQGNLVSTITETSFTSMRSCEVTVEQPSTVLLLGNASLGLATGAAGGGEVRFRVGTTESGTASSDRWVNATTDSGDGVDAGVSTQWVTTLEPGPHTFHFSASRYNGPGPFNVYDPVLVALVVPTSSGAILGSHGSDTWTNATTSYTPLRSIDTVIAGRSKVLMFGSASIGLNDTGAGNDFEGQFRLGIDSASGTSVTDRWVNVYTDSTDGTDNPLSLGLERTVEPGRHLFSMVGRRYAGNGTLRAYSPGLALVVAEIDPNIFSDGFEGEPPLTPPTSMKAAPGG